MFPNLKAEMARKGMTMSDLAEKTGMTLQKMSGRMNGKVEFTYSEAYLIKQALGVDLPLEVLFEKREK